MRIFELHFNPPVKNEIADRIFDSFCYEPENIYEKRLGSLYMVGELYNALPQNLHLLQKISQVAKGRYYATPLQSSEKTFQECLRVTNEFLSKEVSKENVSWLGNLNFAMVSLKPPTTFAQKWWGVNLTKVGNLKILLLRAGKTIDIGKNLDFEEIEPYPLKIFTKTVSGKLSFGDKVVILTSEVFDFFSNPPKFSEGKFGRAKQNLLNEFLKIELFDERAIKDILKPGEKEASEISGVLLLIDLTRKSSEKSEVFTFKRELEKFSLKEALVPLIKVLAGFVSFFRKTFEKIVSKLSNLLRLPKLKSKIKIPKKLSFSFLSSKPKIKITNHLNPLKFFLEKFGRVKRNLILVLLLILVLIGGFFVFQREEEKKLEAKEKILSEVQEKVREAENFLIFKNEEKANILFKEAWEEILILTKEEWPKKDKAIFLKKSIEEHLKNLSELEVVSDPKLIFEFDPKIFIPQKMVFFNGELYFFSPLSDKLAKLNLKTKNQVFFSLPWGKDSEVNLATVSDDSIIFFSKPDKIVLFKNDGFSAPFSLKSPYPDFNFISFSSYQGNIYFLDSKRGEIIKYPSPLQNGKDSPQFWLNHKTKKATDGKSMAVDGLIWILSESNTISKYYNGQHQTDVILDIFPFPKRLYKIFTLPYLPYFYLLEPTQNRIIVLKKMGSTSSPQAGEVVKQFQSEKFDNLKDLRVSNDGKTIYLLNGQKIYQLNL